MSFWMRSREDVPCKDFEEIQHFEKMWRGWVAYLDFCPWPTGESLFIGESESRVDLEGEGGEVDIPVAQSI